VASTPTNRTDPDPAWDDVLLHVVTGKGGTGKTTVAASLALALASRGKTVLLCEVEGRQGIAQLFDVPPLPYEETRIASGPDDGGDLYALAIDPESALLEYLAMYYRLGRAGKALDRFGVVDFATTIAPGVRDVLLTGKIYEAAYRNKRGKNHRTYDAIVLDAPPTGRIARFLNVNSELAGLAKVGPIRSQADSIMTLLRSPRTAVHLTTVLEDMPVQETADGIAELRANDLPVGAVVVNLVRGNVLDEQARQRALVSELPREQIEKDLDRVGVAATPEILEGLLTEAREQAERRALEDEQRERIAGLGVPTYELPRLPDGIDLGGLYELAADLCEQGLA
jgi:cellulose biosynthesis protein BcsQ